MMISGFGIVSNRKTLGIEMYTPVQPPNLSGFWIWLPDGKHVDNRQVVARKQFSLDQEITESELRICVIPFYHLFINGAHVGLGSAFPTKTHCYIDCYDVSKYLKPGLNTIAVSTLDLVSLNWSMPSFPAKIWCQLFVNGTEVASTDESWLTVVNDNFSGAQPRCHFGMTRTEQICMSDKKSGWAQDSYDDSFWSPAKIVQPFPEGTPKPVLSGLKPRFWNRSEAFDVTLSGTFSDDKTSTYYDYQGFPDRQPGNYAAQTFAFSMEERDVQMAISADDPYMIFCNGDLVAANQHSCSLDRFETYQSPQPGIDLILSFSVHLKKGWNRFQCYQNLSRDRSMGLMLMFPELHKGKLTFQRACTNAQAMAGWIISGPLHVPFNYSAPSFMLEELPEDKVVTFVPNKENINDISAYLGNCGFTVDNQRDPDDLHEGEFLLYDLGTFHYGLPCLDISGTPGDIVDVTCGLRTDDRTALTIGPLGRMTDTLILGNSNQWIRTMPRGSRYVMISVRKAAAGIRPVFHFITSSSDLGSDSLFECSDPTLNSCWERAMASLRPCVSQNIIDDPCAKRCQILPESFIYSRTLYNLSGGCDIPEKAIREFAETQLETGMMLKIVPSGIYSYSPDAALIWIIWLEDHWMYTGDLDFIKLMEPCMTRLLRFFRQLSQNGRAVLQSERAGHCMFLNKNLDMTEKNIFTPLNALYYRAVVAAFHLYLALRMKDQARECEKLSIQLAAELTDMMKSPRGIFADAYLETGRVDAFSLYTNLMVLNSGMINLEKDIKIILQYCCQDTEALLNDCDSPFLFFILETLFKYKQNELGFELMREAIVRSLNKPCIYAMGGNPHITCITAVGFIIRELLGVRPALPGGMQIEFSPSCGLIDSAMCRLPMGKGLISVEWECREKELRIDIASNSPIDVLPEMPAGFAATVDLNKFVNLLPQNTGKM